MAFKSQISVVGCGNETGQYWGGQGESIGVNDCWKFGHPTDYLLVIDAPSRFTPIRKKIIERSKPKHFIADSKGWLRYFYDPDKVERIKPNMNHKELFCTNGSELIKYRFSKWAGTLHKDRIQYSHTSPFAAISLAYVLGYKEITLWGVDFKTHQAWREGKPQMEVELQNYKALFEELEKVGVEVKVGHQNSLLSKILPVLV